MTDLYRPGSQLRNDPHLQPPDVDRTVVCGFGRRRLPFEPEPDLSTRAALAAGDGSFVDVRLAPACRCMDGQAGLSVKGRQNWSSRSKLRGARAAVASAVFDQSDSSPNRNPALFLKLSGSQSRPIRPRVHAPTGVSLRFLFGPHRQTS